MADPADPDPSASTPAAPTVTPRRDGPLVVEGDITLVAPDGTVTACAGRTFLCRCGGSATKPLCDGTHKHTDFSAPGVVPPRKPGP